MVFGIIPKEDICFRDDTSPVQTWRSMGGCYVPKYWRMGSCTALFAMILPTYTTGQQLIRTVQPEAQLHLNGKCIMSAGWKGRRRALICGRNGCPHLQQNPKILVM